MKMLHNLASFNISHSPFYPNMFSGDLAQWEETLLHQLSKMTAAKTVIFNIQR